MRFRSLHFATAIWRRCQGNDPGHKHRSPAKGPPLNMTFKIIFGLRFDFYFIPHTEWLMKLIYLKLINYYTLLYIIKHVFKIDQNYNRVSGLINDSYNNNNHK